MAIPVANPPPRYEPGSVPPPPPPPEPPRTRDPRAGRGCVTIVGVAGAIGCVISIALGMSCQSLFRIGEREAVHRITASYRAAAVANNESTADEPQLRALERLADAGEISLVAFGILNNRWNDALANDGVVDANELHGGMQLVCEIVLGGGNVDIQRYPDGR
jgi:hypothetical protein